jgi:hypothetical protein
MSKQRQTKQLPGQHYDVATKVLMDTAAEAMLETFLGIRAADIEVIDELPQESASLKRSDYILRVIDAGGQARIVLWEFLSKWRRRAILNLCDYTVRAYLKYTLPMQPVVLLLAPSPQAAAQFEEPWLSFRFTLLKLYEIPAKEFLAQTDIHLLPFVPVMQDGEHFVQDAENRIYHSVLSTAEKADLLAALTIFAGFKSKDLARQLVERRRDLMIQSAAYDIIKQEGIQEGIRKGEIRSKRKDICDILQARFDFVPDTVFETLNRITAIHTLESLVIKSATIENLSAFYTFLERLLASEEKTSQEEPLAS